MGRDETESLGGKVLSETKWRCKDCMGRDDRSSGTKTGTKPPEIYTRERGGGRAIVSAFIKTKIGLSIFLEINKGTRSKNGLIIRGVNY